MPLHIVAILFVTPFLAAGAVWCLLWIRPKVKHSESLIRCTGAFTTMLAVAIALKGMVSLGKAAQNDKWVPAGLMDLVTHVYFPFLEALLVLCIGLCYVTAERHFGWRSPSSSASPSEKRHEPSHGAEKT